jgi:hypothetical protein
MPSPSYLESSEFMSVSVYQLPFMGLFITLSNSRKTYIKFG